MLNLISYKDFQKTSTFFMLKPCRAVYGFLITLCVVILISLIWASFAPMNDTVKATVMLRPQEDISSVRCITSGQVVEKNYKNDDSVSAGTLLYALNVSGLEKDLESFISQEKNILEQIQVNNAQLEVMHTGKLPEADIFSHEFIAASAYLYARQNYEAEVEKARLNLQREKDLPVALKIPQNIEDLQLAYGVTVLNLNTWKNNQVSEALTQKNELENSLNSIRSSIAETKQAIQNSVVYAPIPGKILEVKKMNKGDFVLAGEEILKIIPSDSEFLKADLYIDPSYIACVKVGNPVRIKFPGLPPSRFGQVETEISMVQADATQVDSSTYFVAQALVKNTHLADKRGFEAILLPGLTAEARIITDTSTVLRMFLRKLDFVN